MTSRNWREHAACRGLHPNLFHGERGDSHALQQAINVCLGNRDTGDKPCPVLDNCLNWILDIQISDDLYGIYAGTTPNQRVKLRRDRHRPIERDIERVTPVGPAHAPAPATPAVAATTALDPVAWVARYEAELLATLEREQTGKENTPAR